MADLVRKALEDSLVALRRVEWSGQNGTKCPACGRPKSYGMHVCSCMIALAFKRARSAGIEPPPPRGADVIDEPCTDRDPS